MNVVSPRDLAAHRLTVLRLTNDRLGGHRLRRRRLTAAGHLLWLLRRRHDTVRRADIFGRAFILALGAIASHLTSWRRHLGSHLRRSLLHPWGRHLRSLPTDNLLVAAERIRSLTSQNLLRRTIAIRDRAHGKLRLRIAAIFNGRHVLRPLRRASVGVYDRRWTLRYCRR
jgi:hypothetical protein